MNPTAPIEERTAIVEARKAQHFTDVTLLLATSGGHANSHVAGYLMGVVTALTNAQASSAALEAACRFGLAHGRIDQVGVSRAIAIACSDGEP